MSTEIAHPLSKIISAAARKPVDGPVAKLKARFQNCTDAVIVLCDVSGSMDDCLGGGDASKWDHMKAALQDVVQALPKVKIFDFDSRFCEVKRVKDLRQPCGSTNLAGAIRFIEHYRPRKTIIITDGIPDNRDLAAEAASDLTGAIDTIYCGPDADPAVEWLRTLSRSCGGSHATWDGYVQLTSVVRLMLPAPAANRP